MPVLWGKGSDVWTAGGSRYHRAYLVCHKFADPEKLLYSLVQRCHSSGKCVSGCVRHYAVLGIPDSAGECGGYIERGGWLTASFNTRRSTENSIRREHR